jgi:hypothetical protein
MDSCPDRETIAAYVDRRRADGDRDAARSPPGRLRDCRAEVVALSALVAQVAGSAGPVAALRSPLRARRWGPAVARGTRRRRAPRDRPLPPGTAASRTSRRPTPPCLRTGSSTRSFPNPGAEDRVRSGRLCHPSGRPGPGLAHAGASGQAETRRAQRRTSLRATAFSPTTAVRSSRLRRDHRRDRASTWIQRLTESGGKRLHLRKAPSARRSPSSRRAGPSSS